MDYSDTKIGFVCSGDAEKKPVPMPVPAPVTEDAVKFLREELLDTLVYSAWLEREVLRLSADPDHPFYLH